MTLQPDNAGSHAANSGSTPAAATLHSHEDFGILRGPKRTSSLYLPFAIKEPSADFYPQTVRDLLPCCGYEYGTKEFHSAVHLLNDRLSLGLDPLDLRVMALLLTGLSQANRFGRDLHISEEKGENSATHSCHTAILNTELFRRAQLLRKEAQSPEVIELRIESTLADLVHDVGESLGEFSSLADRSLDVSRTEIPEVERRVFAICLRLAYAAALEGPGGGAGYLQKLWDFRLRAREGKLSKPMTLSAAINAIEYFEAPGIIPELDYGTEGRITRYLSLFDLCELREGDVSQDRSRLFTGTYAKICERLQGTRHILRFGSKDIEDTQNFVKLVNPQSLPSTSCSEETDSAIPLRFVSSTRMLKNASYMEEDLHALFLSADTQEEMALADVVRDVVYLTMAEWFSVSRPVVDRMVKKEDPYLVELQRELGVLPPKGERAFFQNQTIRKYLEHLLARDGERYKEQLERENRGEVQVSLRPIETRERLRAIYLHAVDQKYIPTSGVPLAFGQLPERLRGFEECMSAIERFAYKEPVSDA